MCLDGGRRRSGSTVVSVGLPPSSGSAVMRLAGTAGLLRRYHLPKTSFVFDVAPKKTTMHSLRWHRRELITELITVRCFQTAPADCGIQMWTTRFLMTEKGRFEENQHCSLLTHPSCLFFCDIFRGVASLSHMMGFQTWSFPTSVCR